MKTDPCTEPTWVSLGELSNNVKTTFIHTKVYIGFVLNRFSFHREILLLKISKFPFSGSINFLDQCISTKCFIGSGEDQLLMNIMANKHVKAFDP